MSRYRPPQAKGSRYITPEGAARLKTELHQLWKIERPKVTSAVHEAAKNGDRSENGDYIYGKKRLREIDSRVRYLSKRLDELVIVDRQPDDTGKVYFGATVCVEDEQGATSEYRIVGPDEFDLQRGLISMDSPMSKSMMGKSLDDEILVATPEGGETLWITAIEYKKCDS